MKRQMGKTYAKKMPKSKHQPKSLAKPKKTKAQVSDTARRRVEKLHADEKWERMQGSVANRGDRASESARREKRMAARRSRRNE